jgi:hypothetical protein
MAKRHLGPLEARCEDLNQRLSDAEFDKLRLEEQRDALLAACESAVKALPVLAGMLDTAGLAGADIAQEMLADCRAAIALTRGE